MFKTYSTAQMREAERRAVEECGISLAALMDNAGHSLANTALEMLTPDGRASIFCGRGNNGGDGYVCAASLLRAGVKVDVWGIDTDSLPAGSLVESAAREFVSLGGIIHPLTSDLTANTIDSDLIVDALLGTGLTRPLTGLYAHTVEVICNTGFSVLSCDLPSGINADTGEIMGTAVRADRTLMLGLAKHACYLLPGREYFGVLSLADIGLP